jgi:hypothetical protein
MKEEGGPKEQSIYTLLSSKHLLPFLRSNVIVKITD